MNDEGRWVRNATVVLSFLRSFCLCLGEFQFRLFSFFFLGEKRRGEEREGGIEACCCCCCCILRESTSHLIFPNRLAIDSSAINNSNKKGRRNIEKRGINEKQKRFSWKRDSKRDARSSWIWRRQMANWFTFLSTSPIQNPQSQSN